MKTPIRSTLLLAALALVGCDDGTGPEVGTTPVSLSVALRAPTASAAAATWQPGAPPVARSQTFDDGTNELIIDRASIVLSEIELERMFDDDCDDNVGDDSLSDDDDCEEFDAGPVILDLPLDGTVEQVLSVEVPADVYDELEFELDKLDDDDADEIQLLRDNPEFNKISVRVEGTWNGEPFVFVSDVEAEQELELITPLEITEDGGPTNLTLSLDIDGWFRDVSMNLIDPRTALKGGEFEEIVEDNIERSFEIFEDEDRDGDDDHDDDDFDVMR